MALQRTAGNRAVCRLMLGQSPTGVPPSRKRVLARSLHVTVTWAGGVITAATLTGRLPTNIHSGQQGQHTTSDKAIKVLIQNAVIGQTFAGAAANLQTELTQASYLPGVQSGASAHLEGHWILPYPNPASVNELIDDIQHVARVRGQVDLVAYSWPPQSHPPTSGVHEGNIVGGLNILERELRNHPGVAPPGGYGPADVQRSMWDLFHFNPRTAANDAELAAALIQHAYTIGRAFPLVSAHFGITYITLLNDLFAGNNMYALRIAHSHQSHAYLAPGFQAAVQTRLADYLNNSWIPQYGGAGNPAYAPRIGPFGYTLH